MGLKAQRPYRERALENASPGVCSPVDLERVTDHDCVNVSGTADKGHREAGCLPFQCSLNMLAGKLQCLSSIFCLELNFRGFFFKGCISFAFAFQPTTIIIPWLLSIYHKCGLQFLYQNNWVFPVERPG